MSQTRQIVRIDGTMDEDLLNKFVQDLNAVPNDVEKIYVYFTSHGGQIWTINQFLDIFNKYSDKIHLVLGPEVHSSAFEIAYKYQGEMELIPDAFAILHIYNCDSGTRYRTNKDTYEYWNHKYSFPKTLEEQIDMCSRFLTAKELRRMKSGKEVFISSERLAEIIKNKQEKNG